MPVKILIADDDAMLRESLKLILDLEEDFQVVAVTSDGKETLEKCRQLLPDIVLMDIRMPVMDGVESTRQIKENMPDTRVVILTTFKDEDYIKRAMQSGAEGYILKNQSPQNMTESLRAVYRGGFVFQKEIADSLSSMLGEATNSWENGNLRQENYKLSSRELDILHLVGEGLSNREISGRLYLSEGTVRNYVASLLDKLNLRDRTQLAIFYVKHFEK